MHYDKAAAIEAVQWLGRAYSHDDDTAMTCYENVKDYIHTTDHRLRATEAERDYLRRWLGKFVNDREITAALLKMPRPKWVTK